MRQFLDHFAHLSQMNAGAWIATGAMVTLFLVGIGALAWLFQSAITLYSAMEETRNQGRDNG